MPGAFEARSHEERLAIADAISRRVHQAFSEKLLAIGIYGSTARGDDGPYSDLEMLVVLDSVGEDHTHEWLHDGLKAEVNFAVGMHSRRGSARSTMIGP